METSSMLSSLNDECKSDNYIEPHYKEWYRVAVDTLIEHGLDAYQEFLATERVSDFLAEEEIAYILKNVQKVAQSTAHGNDNSYDDTSSSGTYWPVESDVEAPNLDLGWPYVMPGLLGGTHIDLLFHPPRAQLLTIKETIRKMIKEARKVIFQCLSFSLFFSFFFYSKHCRDISIGKDRMEKIPWLNLRSMGTLVFLVPLLIDFIRGAQF